MSRTTALLLLILLAGGAAVWLLLAEDTDETGDPGDPPRTGATGDEEAPPPARQEDEGAALAGSPEARRTRPKRPTWPVIPTDEFPRGVLEITPLAPDETPYSPKDVTVRLEREQTGFWAPPLGVPDYETGTWRFDKVPIGRVQVTVFGDHIIHTVERSEVVEGKTTKLEVFADRGGAVHYQAKLYSGEAPTEVKLRLLDAETKKAVSAYWQVRLRDAHNSARRTTEVAQGPDGHVFGIPSGRYVLWAESPLGEIDQVDLVVKRGETTEAEILLRK